jgi:hypothetical protein
MGIRGRGCFTPAAMLFVVGFWLILWGSMAEAGRQVWYGILCLAAAAKSTTAALWVRWQGWE